jgi:hypothetical protein
MTGSRRQEIGNGRGRRPAERPSPTSNRCPNVAIEYAQTFDQTLELRSTGHGAEVMT